MSRAITGSNPRRIALAATQPPGSGDERPPFQYGPQNVARRIWARKQNQNRNLNGDRQAAERPALPGIAHAVHSTQPARIIPPPTFLSATNLSNNTAHHNSLTTRSRGRLSEAASTSRLNPNPRPFAPRSTRANEIARPVGTHTTSSATRNSINQTQSPGLLRPSSLVSIPPPLVAHSDRNQQAVVGSAVVPSATTQTSIRSPNHLRNNVNGSLRPRPPFRTPASASSRTPGNGGSNNTSLAITYQGGAPSGVQPKLQNNPRCSICIEVPNEFPHLLPTSACTHTSSICASCLEQYISHAVLTQGSTTLTCPDSGCRETMEYADVVRVAKSNQACLDRYEALVLRRTLENEPNFVWCKNPTCSWGQLHESGDAAPVVICQVCNARTCFTHDVPWHTGLTCEQYTAQRNELETQDLASKAYFNEHTKTCPNTSCARRIEKSGGCDHMTCRRPAGCGHEFCWLCLADYGPIRKNGNHHHEPTCAHYAGVNPPERRNRIFDFNWDDFD